jgi:lipopolysaccharide transport system ATP-binding protein
MYVRLAFAVAAHLEPEILIVDEVLAVGDAQFQKKCLGKMEEVSKCGRTVLFVSHNMAAVKRLCTRGIRLKDGSIVADTDSTTAAAEYLCDGPLNGSAIVPLRDFRDRSGDGSARIVEATMRHPGGTLTNSFSVGDSILIEFQVEYAAPSRNFSHSVEIINSDGVPIYHLWDVDSRIDLLPSTSNRVVRALIPDVNLFPDRYSVNLWVGDSQGNRADRVMNCLAFNLEQANASIHRQLSTKRGLIFKKANWSYDESASNSTRKA